MTLTRTGSLRMNTGSSQPRTSSNIPGGQQFGNAMNAGLKTAGSAIGQLTRPLVGGPQLSASISDAARNMASGGGLSGSDTASHLANEGDMGSLQNEMVKNNEEMLAQQIRVGQITASLSTRSNTVKALFDVLKTIGSNIR